MTLCFTINGRKTTVETEPDRRVIDLLREELGLTGTKEGCGSGECGACTILVDGENRLACLMVAAQLEGRTVLTIEGMANGEELHPLQEAFVRCGAVQCGFCSPGMILSAAVLLERTLDPSRREIREGLSGNLCRCTGYQKIIDAVEAAAGVMNPGSPLRDPSAPPAHRKGVPAARRAGGDMPQRFPTTPADVRRDPHRKGLSRGETVFLPGSLPELWSCMEGEPESRVFAGGTDLFVQWRRGQGSPAPLIGLERIAELQGVREEQEFLWIGAAATHGSLLNDPRIRRHLPVLGKALETLGSPPIRNMGTIGGNLCTASPAGDTLPPLVVLEAEVVLRSAKTERRLPLLSFISGPGKTGLERGEILTAVRVKKPVAYDLHRFEKIGQRKALACSVVSLAALIRRSPSGVIEAVRLAWGSVGRTIVVSPDAERSLLGETLTPAALERAARIARQAVSPIDDLRASADYRRTASGNLLLRLSQSVPERE